MRLLTTFAMALAMVTVILADGGSAQNMEQNGNAPSIQQNPVRGRMVVGHSFPYPGSGRRQTTAVLLPQRLRAALNRPGGGVRPGLHLELGRGLDYGYGAIYPYPLQNVTGLPRYEEPTYFSKFPPVYYSHRVARPYGISPFAVPPGIVPVEMGVTSEKIITNPYFEEIDLGDEVDGLPGPRLEPLEIEGNQSTRKRNPFLETIVGK